MHIWDDTSWDATQAVCQGVDIEKFAETIKPKLKELMDDAYSSLLDSFQDSLAGDAQHNLHGEICRAAGDFIQAVLDGNEDKACNLFGLHGYTGRPEKWNWRDWVHNGSRDFSPVGLRRRLVEAHKDLLTDARLEDQRLEIEALRRELGDVNDRLHRYRTGHPDPERRAERGMS